MDQSCKSLHRQLYLFIHPTHSHPAADGRGRERQRESTSTLEVPEQQRMPAHHIRSRSVSPHREEQGRIRSRPPNIPAQRLEILLWRSNMHCFALKKTNKSGDIESEIFWVWNTARCKTFGSGGCGELHSGLYEFHWWQVYNPLLCCLFVYVACSKWSYFSQNISAHSWDTVMC